MHLPYTILYGVFLLITCPAAAWFALKFPSLIGLKSRSSQVKLNTLPSPPSLPILGHVLSVPLSAPWFKFSEWYSTYGETILLRMLGMRMVVLNTVEAAHELLEKKGGNFSGRPNFYYYTHWLGWDSALAFMQYDNVFRKQRRLMRPHLSPSAIVDHYPSLYERAELLLEGLKTSPEDFLTHIQNYISSVSVMIIYGYRPTSRSDPRLRLVETVAKITTEIEITTVLLLDFFPFLRHLPAWLPGMQTKRIAVEGSRLREEMAESFLKHVLDSKESGAQNKSLMSQVIDDLQKETGDAVQALEQPKLRRCVAHLGAVLYLAGVDTSVSALTTFILAMTLHPDIRKKAQAEIDSVTGGPGVRMPTLEDRVHLPYVECILREVLRWNPPVPVGVVHRSERVDDYNAKEIPANSLVVPNIWFMCHDDAHFPSPLMFAPERHLRSKDSTDPVVEKPSASSRSSDPKRIVFGFGRRVCPGENLADAMLWTAMVYILATFDILAPTEKDIESGRAKMPTAAFTGGGSSHPEEFDCRFILREGSKN